MSIVNRKKATYSHVRANEHLVFFRTSAWLSENGEAWHVPIHAWIYKPQQSYARKHAFLTLLKKKYGLVASDKNSKSIDDRVNLLLADNKRGRRVVITLGDTEYLLPKSKKNGHIEAVLTLPVASVTARPHMLRFNAKMQDGDTRVFSGESLLISPVGRSVISDIDDTVKVSQVTETKALLNNTFFNDFSPVAGMSTLYQQLHQLGFQFHFVSSSPWHLYFPLCEFLEKYNFPWATLRLKKIRLKDKTLFNLFKKGTKTKPIVIEHILNHYPQHSFFLVGDSGEQDARVYADIAAKYPRQIEKIFIRDIAGSMIDNESYDIIFKDIPKEKWQIFLMGNDIKIT